MKQSGRKVLGGLKTTRAIILSIPILIFGVLALVNFFGGVAAQLLQIGVSSA